LLRTSTDRNGRYAADALPDDRITLLVSPPDRMPLATRGKQGEHAPGRARAQHDRVLDIQPFMSNSM
jgi:hypothetical protein